MISRGSADRQALAHSPGRAADLRTTRRVPVQVTTRFSATGNLQHVGDGVVLDLSENGCKLRNAQADPLSELRALYLTIPETSRLILISEIRLIWTANNECGIEFLHIMARERSRLRHFIWKQVNRSALKGGITSSTTHSHLNLLHSQFKSLP
jgi:PilZ domain